MKPLLRIALLFLSFLMVFDKKSQGQVFTYTVTYTNASPTAGQQATWMTYLGNLAPLPYFKMRVTSGTIVDSCINTTIIQDIALKLRTYGVPAGTGPVYTWVDGTNTWMIGNCAGQGPELGLNQATPCQCPNPGKIIRSACLTCVGNPGGWGTATCGSPTQTITLEFFYGYPCDQKSPVGTVIEGPNEVCPKKLFSQNISGNITGLTYQWQTSPDGVTWTNFTGTVSPAGVMTDAITVATWYRCKVVCTATSLTYTTPAKLVSIAPFYYCYCDTKGTSVAGADVGRVVVTLVPSNDTLLKNGVGTPVENNPASNSGYADFRYTVPPVPMYHDSTYRLTVSQINSAAFVAGTEAIYIDCNRNGTFDDSELVLKKPTVNILPNPGIGSGTFQLPASAEYGLTGMRVIVKGGGADPDTCGNYTDGESEDYLIDLRYIPCNGKPDIGHIEGDTSMCVGYNYVLRDTSYEKFRHGIVRYWQVSADGAIWYDIAGSKNKDTLARYFTGQPFYYRIMGVCTHSNDTGYTNPHKVNIKPGYKCYCHSQSMGLPNDTSDIGGFTITNFAVTDGGTHLKNNRAFNLRQDYTDLEPIKMDVDSIYKFSVFHTMPFENHADAKITVFVDFNNNKQYDIPDERIFTGFTSIGYHVLLNNLIIPNTVIVDVPTGLRIILNNDVSPNKQSDEACGEYASGETEDYIVMFKRSFKAGINDVAGIQQLSLTPNPTNGKFQVQFKGAASKDGVSIKIQTMTGQVVKQQVYPHTGDIFRQEIDLGNEAKGIYMVEVTADGQKVMQKLTVQ